MLSPSSKKSAGHSRRISHLSARRLGRRQLHGKRSLLMHDRDCSWRRARIRRREGLPALRLRRWSMICSRLTQRAEVDIATAVIDLGGHGRVRGLMMRLRMNIAECDGCGPCITVAVRDRVGEAVRTFRARPSACR